MTDNINQARNRISADSKCLRTLITGVPLTAGQELYPISSTINLGLPAAQGQYVIEVICVTIYWGNMRVKCENRSFTEQDAKLRTFTTYTSRPGSFAMVGNNMGYLNPVPDQAYVSDWDVVVLPAPLVTSADTEVIPVVWQPPIAYYAAHISKYGEQSLSESDIFYKKYLIERAASAYGSFSSRFRNAYRR